MNGRLTGSEDYLKAAAYVVDHFKSFRLAPAGVNGGYYQPVHFDVQRVIASKSSMSLVVDGKTTPLVLGEDAVLGSRSAQMGKVDAPLVFIGYGLHLPESKYDDFNSAEVPLAELKGKIVVYINSGPADLSGSVKSFARTSPLPGPCVRPGRWVRFLYRLRSRWTSGGSGWPVALRSRGCGCRLLPMWMRWRQSILHWRASGDVFGDVQSSPNGEAVCRDSIRSRMRRSRCCSLRWARA
jgi:hypothetical protein